MIGVYTRSRCARNRNPRMESSEHTLVQGRLGEGEKPVKIKEKEITKIEKGLGETNTKGEGETKMTSEIQ
jgi:hypothetical protein